METRDFPPIDPEDLPDIDVSNRQYRSWRQRSRWRNVARVSVAAVSEKPGPWDIAEWVEYGRSAGLRGTELEWFGALRLAPICVVSGEWVNGRHKARALALAGVDRVAVEDPDCEPECRDEGADQS